MDRGIAELSHAFDKRFDKVFPIPSNYETEDPKGLKDFSQAITSNLIGGVGYFYGRSIIDRSFSYEWDRESDVNDENEDEKGPRLTEPRELLTATPSRSFFPRGFYWYVFVALPPHSLLMSSRDEGFHLLHIGEWDNDLRCCVQVSHCSMFC